MFGLHWTLEPWLSECVQFKTKHSRKRKKITNKKTTSISRIVNVLDTYQKIIFTVSRKAIYLSFVFFSDNNFSKINL